jgi:hypothetical protein
VNGIRCINYGPQPKDVYNPDGKTLNIPGYVYYPDYIDAEGYVVEGHSHPDNRGYSTVYPHGIRQDIRGVVLPEFDLLLHEGYRYLDKIYPDHPDYIDLLTLNEMNDEFDSAASSIGYDMDEKYFDDLATKLPWATDPDTLHLEGADLDKAMDQEALKLKIRDLQNHAFSRKLYGTFAGYDSFS